MLSFFDSIVCHSFFDLIENVSNIVENNNKLTGFKQIWPEFIFTDKIPDEAPRLTSATKTEQFENKDRSVYTVYTFNIDNVQISGNHEYLVYLSNFQLEKEFRQGKSWILKFLNNEESLRNVILPGRTLDRSYTPEFTNGQYQIPYTSINPVFDFENCRIHVGLDFEKLFFNGWIYIGKNLESLLRNGNALPPFSDAIWLLKDFQTNKKARFDVTEQKAYILPGSSYDGEEKSDTIITTTIMNDALNKHAVLDEGVYW